ncbi:hypothetical protein HOT82_gp083 [Gordonia phage Ronaldo]|uniref:Uncharacterized protein n=2 Tax=Ronaldovirus ronaldo TaxID=2734270 RepID=A0A6B9LKT5_9CAUD|nr:hypothetical protein HOT82_gp083 [Gordonia phage Ronaldo]AXN53645.1 hypothetical protein SEA_RONALDO_83 [Gordonia phage Ronaldo]QHB38199.1 hypothetical protein SEA_VOLT_83 [Gordonia phage Volt]
MSQESSLWLNRNVLIGLEEKRGKAWHWRKADQGDESNHYPMGIPMEEVERRLFNWEPLRASIVAEVELDDAEGFEEANGINHLGEPVVTVPIPGRIAIVRSDTRETLGVFKDTYQEHPYKEWLLEFVAQLLGDHIVISSAGLLRNGGQAWVEVSMDETFKDDLTGFEFMPNLLAYTSLDGTLSTNYKETVTSTVCDNTFGQARAENNGNRSYRRKHSKYSVADLETARAELGLEFISNSWTEDLHSLAKTDVSKKQFSDWLNLYVPEPDTDHGRSLARADVKRNSIIKLWTSDERVSPWAGTALGVLQAVNTYQQHESPVYEGTIRAERNMNQILTGKMDKLDMEAMELLNQVLAS